MKLYFSKKERMIQSQEKTIQRLMEENECLREQLKEYCPENVQEVVWLAKMSRMEYNKLSRELTGLKSEYQKVIRDVKRDGRQLGRMIDKKRTGSFYG